MSNCDSPLCLTPTDKRKLNVKLKVPDELLNYTPLEQLSIPKNPKIRSSFFNFLSGNINEKEFVKFKCFPSHQEQGVQVVTKIRNRHQDLTLQLKKQAAIDKARQRWHKLAEVIRQNIQLRKQIDTNYQSKIISRIELGLKIQNQQAHQSIIIDDLKNHQLRTMTIIKEKHQKQNQSCFISPKHYYYTLQGYLQNQSDEYLYIYHQNLPNTSKLTDKQYNQLLQTYLNKKQLFEKYQEEIKQRKIIKWKPLKSQSTFYNSSMSSKSFGLNINKPMQRMSNPLQSQQQQRQKEYNLINRINELANPKVANNVKTKKFFRQQQINSKLNGVVKHNRIFSFNQIDKEEDDVLDLSNASITEALLDQLYLGSQKLQTKLRQQPTVQKKVRDILRLQEMKANTINANYQKLNKYQQQHQ
ncbi:unnamed protein product [Paramecium pentaurelia]|uniref:Uncharacterized protein n=1 Tax=Paramecium pentaurelia TaxID=43138 RepID=A0A8S1XP56_9CILI|nr:unnamed protein product [Paramecium pentaurelia]